MTAPVPFDGVFKMAGVHASAGTSKGWVVVKEIGSGVNVELTVASSLTLTVTEARSLAAQIMELARRHEVRKTQR